MKVFKYALAAAGALVLAALVFVGWFVVTFDVRDHEPRIVAFVKEKTGRTLTIRGETKLALWPDLGVTLGPVTLSERDSDAVFAEVANARLVAKLRPLLSKQLVADELHLEGASLRIVRFTNGRLNIDDLLSGEGGSPDFDIARARVQRSGVVYEDLATGARHEVSDLDLVTGRLRNGVATPITVSFRAGDREGYGVAVAGQARVTFDMPQRVNTVDGAKLKVEGKAGSVSELAAKIEGDIKWSAGVLAANAVSVAGRCVVGGRPVEGSAAIAALRTTNAGIEAESVSLDARSQQQGESLHATLKAPRLDWREGAMSADAAVLDLDLARDGRKLRAGVVANVRAVAATRSVELSDMRSKFAATGAGLPKRGVEGALAGSANLDIKAERVDAKLAGTVLESRVKGTLAVSGFAAPAYTFALDVDALDLDRIELSGGGSKGGGFDPADYSNLRATGTLRVGSLKSSGVVAKNVQLAMKP